MDVIRRTDIVDQLGAITSPTLVVVGELDPVTPVGAAEEIVAALPEGLAQLEVIRGAGHWAWKDAPERFWPMIVEFVDRTAGLEPVENWPKPCSAVPAAGRMLSRCVTTWLSSGAAPQAA